MNDDTICLTDDELIITSESRSIRFYNRTPIDTALPYERILVQYKSPQMCANWTLLQSDYQTTSLAESMQSWLTSGKGEYVWSSGMGKVDFECTSDGLGHFLFTVATPRCSEDRRDWIALGTLSLDYATMQRLIPCLKKILGY
jgi:hypothetical protein